MAIPEAVVADVLVKCARHCCICRRFDPLHLQVHHIEERSKGGSDDSDNLIAICLTCHCDVHTETLFTRRFTVTELKGHRDAIYALVAAGKLPSVVNPDATARAAMSAMSEAAPTRIETKVTLSPTQVEILLRAGTATGRNEGLIEITHGQIQMGDKELVFQNQREGTRYKEAFAGLLGLGVVDGISEGYGAGSQYYLNAKGYRWVDQLVALGAHRKLPAD